MNTQNPLRITGVRVLEDWAMMLVDEVTQGETALFELSEPLYSVVVDVNGVVSGTLRIVAQKAFLATLTRNLLGDEDSHSDEESRDAFREMGNVTAGNFITEAYGSDCVFELLSPRVEEITETELEKLKLHSMACAFAGDEQPILFHFQLNGSL